MRVGLSARRAAQDSDVDAEVFGGDDRDGVDDVSRAVEELQLTTDGQDEGILRRRFIFRQDLATDKKLTRRVPEFLDGRPRSECVSHVAVCTCGFSSISSGGRATLLETAAFIQFMYGRVPADLQAEVTVWDSRTKHSNHVPFTDPKGVVLAAAQREMQGFDCYYGVGLTRPGLGTGLRGSKFDVVALPAFYLDVDIRGDGHASQALPTESEAFEVIEMCSLEPTLIVHSGGGLHAYWCFEEAWIIAPGETEKANNLV